MDASHALEHHGWLRNHLHTIGFECLSHALSMALFTQTLREHDLMPLSNTTSLLLETIAHQCEEVERLAQLVGRPRGMVITRLSADARPVLVLYPQAFSSDIAWLWNAPLEDVARTLAHHLRTAGTTIQRAVHQLKATDALQWPDLFQRMLAQLEREAVELLAFVQIAIEEELIRRIRVTCAKWE